MPPRPNLKEFRKVRADDGKNAADNEIRVVATRGQRNYISYAIDLLQGTNERTKQDKIIVTGMGAAMHNAVNIAEVVKRRVAGLHQITEISSQTITDTYEAIAEGKEGMTVDRKVSIITITLSKKPLDTNNAGYQAPLPADQVTEQEDRPPAARRARGTRKPNEEKDAKKPAEKKTDAPAEKTAEEGKKSPAGRTRGRRGADKPKDDAKKPAEKKEGEKKTVEKKTTEKKDEKKTEEKKTTEKKADAPRAPRGGNQIDHQKAGEEFEDKLDRQKGDGHKKQAPKSEAKPKSVRNN